MENNFEEIIDRCATESIKWHYFDTDVLPMWVADMDFLSPKPVIQALQRRVDHGIFGYAGDPKALRRVIVERLARLYGWKVTPEAIVFLPGVVVGFNLACHAFAEPGQAALIQTPVYPPFLGAPRHAGLHCQEMELTREEDGSYSIDFTAFEAAITDETRLFILCNPHNPVGRVFRREELQGMADICARHDLVIVSDEIHCDLVFSGHAHLPIAALSPEIGRRTVTLMAPSKTFNIAGLDCAYAVIEDPDLRRQFQLARRGMVGGPNVLGLTAGLAAYQDGQPWLDELVVYLEANRDLLVETVRATLPRVEVWSPEGTYLAWLDCRQLGLLPSPCEFFIKKGRVAFNDGASFGKGGEGFVRLNFGCPRSMLEDGLERMSRAIK